MRFATSFTFLMPSLRYGLYLLALSALPVMAQRVSFGAKGGLFLGSESREDRTSVPPFTTVSERLYSGRWFVGPYIDIRFVKRVSLETGFFYREMRTEATRVEAVSRYNESTTGSRWDIPVLAKYWFVEDPDEWSPFLGGGVTLGRRSSMSGTGQSVISPGGPNNPGSVITGPVVNVSKPSEGAVGMTATAGLVRYAARVRINLEVRYTHWTSSTIHPSRDEVLAVFGLGF